MTYQESGAYNSLITALAWAQDASGENEHHDYELCIKMARWYLERDYGVDHYPALYRAVLDELAEAGA